MKCTKCNIEKELVKGKSWCKNCKNEYERKRRKKNPESIVENNKKERERYYKKKLQIANVIIVPMKNKLCSICNNEKTLDNFYIAKCKGTIRSMCKECNSDKRKIYYQNNREKTIKQTNKYKVERMKTDIEFKLEQRLRNRIYIAFKSQCNKKTNRTWKYIECSSNYFKKWIEFQLYDNMTFENYGKYWHIDHVKPCSSFDLSNLKEVNECFNWKNLRPYKKEKNLQKSSKINIMDLVLQEIKVQYFLKNYKNMI